MIRLWKQERPEVPGVVHLGMPKTGTTLLQQHLFGQHSQVAYLGKSPQSSPKYPAAVEPLNERLLAKSNVPLPARLPALNRILKSAWASGHLPLWSKEGMTAGGAAKKSRQAQCFQKTFGPGCKAVLFVRHPLKFIESIYFQNLKGFQKPDRERPVWAHHFGPLPQYFSIEQWMEVLWKLPQKGAFGHLRCAETAACYAEVFGKQKVKVIAFESFVRDSRATIMELCDFIGIDGAEGWRLIDGRRSNDRWTDENIDQLKRISADPARSAEFRKSRQTVRNRMLGLDDAGLAFDGPKATVEIPAAWRQRIGEFAREDHRRLVSQWGLRLADYDYPL